MTEPYAFPTAASRHNLYDRIASHLAGGGRVQVSTYLKSTVYGKKHKDMFKVTDNGLYVRRGKKWECIDYCSIRFSK